VASAYAGVGKAGTAVKAAAAPAPCPHTACVCRRSDFSSASTGEGQPLASVVAARSLVASLASVSAGGKSASAAPH